MSKMNYFLVSAIGTITDNQGEPKIAFTAHLIATDMPYINLEEFQEDRLKENITDVAIVPITQLSKKQATYYSLTKTCAKTEHSQ